MSAAHNYPGLFVTFEGGDGVGKTTQVITLCERLERQGFRVLRTREPGGTALGVSIRELILHSGDVSARAEALLYAADRAHHVASLVRPALAAGVIVVQDRYVDSSVAYQGSGRDLGADDVRNLSMWATDSLVPDITILLDAPAAVASARVAFEKGAPDRLEAEGLHFHERVRDAFRALAAAEPQRWRVIDATMPADAVADQVAAQVEPLTGRLTRSGE